MRKFVFTVDVVSETDIDVADFCEVITNAVSGDDVECVVKAPKATDLSEQGYKVWRARVAGIKQSDLTPVEEPVEA